MKLARFLLVLVGYQNVGAFMPQNHQLSSSVMVVPSSNDVSSPSTALSAAMSFDDMTSRVDHFEVDIPKPMGIIFGENPDPYLGLVVDDVSEGMNGGKAGLRVGDQLLSVNEKVVVGMEFDGVMEMLVDAPSTLSLCMYRGPASQLFTVLANQLEEGETIFQDEYDDDDDEESEEVIMDENYESPVQIEVKEQKPLTPGDFVKAFGKLGSMLGETLTAPANEGRSDDNTGGAPPPPKKKKTGLFGIGSESVQLDGQEARGYRREKNAPDEF